MRFNLRLHGRTQLGHKCRADISVYVSSQKDLQEQTDLAARSAAWEVVDPPYDAVPEESQITIEHVERI